MEKAMGHAGKQSKSIGKNKTRRMLTMPEKSDRARNLALLTMSNRTEARQCDEIQKSQTIEIDASGTPHFYIVIPCMPGKPDRIQPEVLTGPCECGNPNCTAVSVRYQCRGCTMIFMRYKSWKQHVGMGKIALKVCPGE